MSVRDPFSGRSSRGGPFGGGPFGGGGAFGGLGGSAPTDVWVLLGVVFATFSLQFFAATQGLVSLLRLSPLAWAGAQVWRVASFPFAGVGPPSFWILLELFILYMFARDVFGRLGRRGFWRLIVGSAVGAALVALAVDGTGRLFGGGGFGLPFAILQGQRFLIAVLVAAFATLNRSATILLFFILPVQARWFIPLEILFGFLAFLGTKDLAGFLGLCAGIAVAWRMLARGGGSGSGGRDLWLRLQERWMRWRLDRLRRRRGFRVVKGDREDPWLHRSATPPPGAVPWRNLFLPRP